MALFHACLNTLEMGVCVNRVSIWRRFVVSRRQSRDPEPIPLAREREEVVSLAGDYNRP